MWNLTNVLLPPDQNAKVILFISPTVASRARGDDFSSPSRSVKLPVTVLEASWIIMSVRKRNILLFGNVFKTETFSMNVTKKTWWNATRTKSKQRSICSEGCHFHSSFFRLNISFNICLHVYQECNYQTKTITLTRLRLWRALEAQQSHHVAITQAPSAEPECGDLLLSVQQTRLL